MKKIFLLLLFAFIACKGFSQSPVVVSQAYLFKQYISVGKYHTVNMPSAASCKGCVLENLDSANFAFSNGAAWLYFAVSNQGALAVSFSNITGSPMSNILLANILNQKVNYTDTGNFLAPYQRSITAVKYIDTGAILAPYQRSIFAVKYSDTGGLVAPYLRTVNFTKAGIGLGNVVNSLQVINTGGVTSFGQGAFSAIPAASSGPTFYYATDTNALYHTNLTSYTKVAGGSSGSGSADSSIFVTVTYGAAHYYPLANFDSTHIVAALHIVPYSATNPAGFITGNQSITVTASGDASGTASGSTSIGLALTVNAIKTKAIPTLAAGNLKYTGSAFTFDNTSYEPAISAPGTTNKYWNGYKAFVALNTDSIAQGSTNKYFTNTLAQNAISFVSNGLPTYAAGLLTIPAEMDSLWRTVGKDSLQFRVGGRYYSILDSAGFSDTTKGVHSLATYYQLTHFQDTVHIGHPGQLPTPGDITSAWIGYSSLKGDSLYLKTITLRAGLQWDASPDSGLYLKPDLSVLASLNTTQTMNNKTLTSPQLNNPILNNSSTIGWAWLATNLSGGGGWGPINAGITGIGAFSAAGLTNGATINFPNLVLAVGDSLNPGMVSTVAQFVKGAKTFVSAASFTNSVKMTNLPSGANTDSVATVDGSGNLHRKSATFVNLVGATSGQVPVYNASTGGFDLGANGIGNPNTFNGGQYRLGFPGTNILKTLAKGIGINIDSLTTNVLTLSADTTYVMTKGSNQVVSGNKQFTGSLNFSGVTYSTPAATTKLVAKDSITGNVSQVDYQMVDTTGAADGAFVKWNASRKLFILNSSAGVGTVTKDSVSGLDPLFTTVTNNPTTTPVTIFTLKNAGPYNVLGNFTSSNNPPTYGQPQLISPMFANQGSVHTVPHGNASGNMSFSTIDAPTELAGVIAAAQMPAFTGGQVSSSAGTLVLTINSSSVTNGMLAGSIAANKLILSDINLPDTQVVFRNTTIGNASTSAHGYVGILPNVAGQYWEGVGNYSAVTRLGTVIAGDVSAIMPASPVFTGIVFTKMISGTTAGGVLAISAGSGAGTSPTVAINRGNYLTGSFSVTAGSSPVAGGLIATITVPTQNSVNFTVFLQSAGANGIAVKAVASDQTHFIVSVDNSSVALINGTTYTWNWLITQ